MKANTLERLSHTILARQKANPKHSWTAHLLQQGAEACAEKFGEEAIEAIIACIKNDKAALIHESADVVYHLLVMLASQGIEFDKILSELEARTKQSGLQEKAQRYNNR